MQKKVCCGGLLPPSDKKQNCSFKKSSTGRPVCFCVITSVVYVCVSFICSYLDHGMKNENETEIEDVCSITLDKAPCGVFLKFLISIYTNQV